MTLHEELQTKQENNLKQKNPNIWGFCSDRNPSEQYIPQWSVRQKNFFTVFHSPAWEENDFMTI